MDEETGSSSNLVSKRAKIDPDVGKLEGKSVKDQEIERIVSFEAEADTDTTDNGKTVDKSSAFRALQNELILTKIAFQLPAKDLWSLRPTFGKWNRAFVPEMRKIQNPIQVDWESLAKVTELLKSSKEIPFSKFRIRNLCFAGDGPKIFKNLVAVCGHSVTELSFVGGNWVQPTKLRTDLIRKAIFLSMPNLTVLELHFGYSDSMPAPAGSGDVAFIPKLRKLVVDVETSTVGLGFSFSRLLNDLIRYAVGLEHLELDGLHESQANEDFKVDTVNSVIVSALRDFSPNLDKLKTLEMLWVSSDDWLTFEILSGLACRKHNALCLSSFTVNIMLNEEDPEEMEPLFTNLRALLLNQSPTLRELKLTIDCQMESADWEDPTEFAPFRIPEMRAVRDFELHLQLNTSNAHELRHVPMKYKGGPLFGNFPALTNGAFHLPNDREELELMTLDGSPDLLIKCEWKLQLNSPKWTYRRQVHDGDVETLAILTRFARVDFSSITRIEISIFFLRVDNFSLLWTEWPCLQVLDIKWTHDATDLEDEGENWSTLDMDGWITGVPANALHNMTAPESLDLAAIRDLQSKYKTGPGISDLHHLREFSLKLDGDFKLTDHTGYFGFAIASQSLRHIDGELKLKYLSAELLKCQPNVNGGANQDGGGEESAADLFSPHCIEVITEALDPDAVVNFKLI